MGGTALRLLYDLRRYSEDLDFSLARKAGYDFKGILDRVVSDLEQADFEVTLHPSLDKTVGSGFLRFPELLYEVGLSPHRGEVLSIKLEVDTNPPEGSDKETTIVNRYFLLSLWHYDPPSLMTGKVHAFLTRDYTKGRDVYDLLWYRTQSPPVNPNIPMLQNALDQTGWSGPSLVEVDWKEIVKRRLGDLDWDEVRSDVGNFLENPEERELLTLDNLVSSL
ncbi:nucleotidyl transferase AbiEii/AbiGii toxin family protein [Candidatus Bipolaricaulota bacterium]|nr:nucleotidyl transferase AbiEii/AbiGii toxin family protein [Candidatus Bipolaricaulota bacterium]